MTIKSQKTIWQQFKKRVFQAEQNYINNMKPTSNYQKAMIISEQFNQAVEKSNKQFEEQFGLKNKSITLSELYA